MDLLVRYDLSPEQGATLAETYQQTWFGSAWDGETVAQLLSGTDEMVALCGTDSGELLAFAHVLTDYTTVAFVRDVVVHEEYQGQGLGRRLVEELANHPALETVDSLAVTCPARLAPFYEGCGFQRREDGAMLRRPLGSD